MPPSSLCTGTILRSSTARSQVVTKSPPRASTGVLCQRLRLKSNRAASNLRNWRKEPFATPKAMTASGAGLLACAHDVPRRHPVFASEHGAEMRRAIETVVKGNCGDRTTLPPHKAFISELQSAAPDPLGCRHLASFKPPRCSSPLPSPAARSQGSRLVSPPPLALPALVFRTLPSTPPPLPPPLPPPSPSPPSLPFPSSSIRGSRRPWHRHRTGAGGYRRPDARALLQLLRRQAGGLCAGGHGLRPDRRLGRRPRRRRWSRSASPSKSATRTGAPTPARRRSPR